LGNAAGRESRFSSRLLLGVAVVIAGSLGLLVLREIGADTALGWLTEGWERLKSAPPIVFFGTMAILTIFPVPLTPFYIVAGPLFGILPSLLWIPPAIVLNNLIAYALTTSFLRPWLQRIVTKRGHSIPTFKSKREQNLFIAMVRITPGFPYFLQSLVLGLAGVDRLRFLVISLPVHMIFVVGFVVLGRSAFDGKYGVAVFAVALIAVASICARFARLRMKQLPDPEDANPLD
jgi:uncharacterized membrane protein YdjX (TVP38/TMEM64 family)